MKIFSVPQVVRVKCDKHSWMGAWVLVLTHPFHAGTGHAGTYELTGIPSGEHRLVAWHGDLGRVETVVTVRDGERREIDLVLER